MRTRVQFEFKIVIIIVQKGVCVKFCSQIYKVLQTIRCRGQMEVGVGVLPICPKITLTGPLTNEPHSLLKKKFGEDRNSWCLCPGCLSEKFHFVFCYFRALHRPSGRIMAVKVSGLLHCGMMKT